MRLIKSCCIALFLAMCLFAVKASASSLSAGEGLSLSSVSNEDSSFMLSKVYFLPDWGGSKLSFEGEGDEDKPCNASCPSKSDSECPYGAETYVNACGKTCSRCTDCSGCIGYNLSSCPTGAHAQCDTCCNGKLFKISGCDNGYILNDSGDGCREKICTDDETICTSKGLVCNNSSGECVECTDKDNCSGGRECVSNSCRCPEGEVWENDQCVEGTCTNGGVNCKDLGLVCNTGSGECVQCMINDDCPTGKVCREDHTCDVDTDPCDGVQCDGGQCVDGKCVCSDSKPHLLDDNVTCVECTDDDHCSGGRECVNNSCRCPSGTVEVKGVCETKNCNNTPSLCDPDTEKCNTSTGLCEQITRSCQVGDILYTDQTCSPYYTRGKTPLGVIIDPKRTLVLALPEGNVPMAEPSLNSTEFTYLIADNWNTSGVSEQQILSEEGLSNTTEQGNFLKLMTLYLSPAVMFCDDLTRESEPAREMLESYGWYVPSNIEALMISEGTNLNKINASLNQLTTRYSPSIKPLTRGKLIWTSTGSVAQPSMMFTFDPFYGGFYGSKISESNPVRCVGRYKCFEEQCREITPRYTIDDLVNNNGKLSLPLVGPNNRTISTPVEDEKLLYTTNTLSRKDCPEGTRFVYFQWNTNYKRCAKENNPGSGGGGSSQKACQSRDYMYCSGSSCYCQRDEKSPSSRDTYMGRVGNPGLVILGPMGVASSYSDAAYQCNKLTKGNFKNWRIVSSSDASYQDWQTIIGVSFDPYGTVGSSEGCYRYPHWETSGCVYDRHRTLYCAHSYSGIYRK